MYYKTCKNCGAHLDPEERCDCEDTLVGRAVLLLTMTYQNKMMPV